MSFPLSSDSTGTAPLHGTECLARLFSRGLLTVGPSRRARAESDGDKGIEEFFELGTLLGSGAFGCAYRAKDRETGAGMVVKVVVRKTQSGGVNRWPATSTSTPHDFSQRLIQLQHPSIVHYDSFFWDEGAAFVCMEHLEGPDLIEFVLDRAMDLPAMWAYTFVRQLLSALAHAHAAGVCHRDVKCENIKLVPAHRGAGFFQVGGTGEFTGVLKLLDFGLVKLDMGSEELVEASAVGTPGYMAPEVIKKLYNDKCDVFSTGVVAHILFATYFPFPTNLRDFRTAVREPLEIDEQAWCGCELAAEQTLAMLSTDVASRPTSREALRAWNTLVPVPKKRQSAATAKLRLRSAQEMGCITGRYRTCLLDEDTTDSEPSRASTPSTPWVNQ